MGTRAPSAPSLACALALVLALPAAAGDAPTYSLSADAVAGFSLAAEGYDPRSAASAANWQLNANLLHRIAAPGWGLVLSHNVDLTGLSAAGSGSVPITPALAVYEAYARLDLGDWGQLFVGKRRLGLGIGTTFAPGDLVNPRSGFWDQKYGFRGLCLTASLGSDLALRAALDLDRNLDAWAAGMRARAATGTAAGAGLSAAYLLALGDAAGPADPRLFVGALSVDWQRGALQLAAAAVYGADSLLRPSLGLSADLGGLILQAEGAADLSEDPASPRLFGTAGARYAFAGDSDSLNLSIDYDYNGQAGILKHTNYLLPWLSWTREEAFTLYVRALVELEAPSALLSAGLTLYPVPGFDLEFTALLCLGAETGEFAALPLPLTPSTAAATTAIGLAARVHF